MSMTVCDVVIPCRDEAAALPAVLADVPEGWRVIVVDNGSTDGTADVARSLGAHVVTEDRPGYGAAVHAGMLAADAEFVAVMDGDASMRLADLVPMYDLVSSGGTTFLIVTHDPRLAARCDRLIEMVDGRIQSGKATVATKRPDDTPPTDAP